MKNSSLLRLHFIVFLWGFTAILGKIITVDAQNLVFYRMLFCSLFLFIFIRIIRKQSLKISKQILLKLLIIGGFMAFHWLCFFYSIKISNVSIALSCLSLSTLFAAILEPIIFKRKIDPFEICIGLIIVICISTIFKVEIHYKEGIFYGILTALLGTVFSVYNGKLYGKTSSGNIIFYEIFGGFMVITLFYLFSGQIDTLIVPELKDFGFILLLASLFTAYPMLESVNLMKYISPFTLILTVNLEPVYGIVLAFFIFGESEQMSPWFYAASFVMILAIVINGIVKSKRSKNN